MPLPNENEIALFGPLIPPFGRNTRADKVKTVAKGEDLFYDIGTGTYDATDNHEPDDITKLSSENYELLLKDCPAYRNEFLGDKYLWVIGTFGLRLIKELTRNEARIGKKYVCHTNLTGSKEAYQGGELWFCEDGRIGLNYFSDRYGATTEAQWNAVIAHFKRVGYGNTEELFPIK